MGILRSSAVRRAIFILTFIAIFQTFQNCSATNSSAPIAPSVNSISAVQSSNSGPRYASTPIACVQKAGVCDVILSPASNNIISVDGRNSAFASSNIAGKVLCIPAATKPYAGFWMYQTGGTSGKPVTITNCGGQVVFSTNVNNAVVTFDHVNYLHFTGTGSGDMYGIKVVNTYVAASALNASGHAVQAQPGSSDVEIDHVEAGGSQAPTWDANGNVILAGGQGITAETYPNCSTGEFTYVPGSSTNWVMKNIFIHDNHVLNTKLEGFYIGPSHFGWIDGISVNYYTPGSHQCTGVFEPGAENIVVEHNLLENVGNSAIQVGAAYGGAKINHNIVREFGLNQDNYHASGIAVNPGTKATVDSNYLRQSSPSPVGELIKFQGIDGSIFTNNVLIGAHGGFELLRNTDVNIGQTQGKSYFYQNTIVGTVAEAIGIYCNFLGSAVLENNLFAGYGAVLYSGNGNSNIGCIGSYTSTNYFEPDSSKLHFKDLANGDVHLTSQSPVIGKGLSLKGIVDVDNEGNARGSVYDMGAYDYKN